MHLLILGMHRSGTSLVAGLTNLMGFYVGGPDSLMLVADDNPKGFWERLDVVDINDALLAGEGASWVNPLPYSAGTPSPDLDRRMHRVLEELDSHGPWLIKDPRLCVTLAAWTDKIHMPRIVFVHRAALPIARSLQHRNGLPLRYGLALWEQCTVRAFKAMVSYPHYLIRHGDLLADPPGSTTALFQWLKDQGCDNIEAPTGSQVEDLFDPGLVHQRPDPAEAARFLSPEQRLLDKAIRDGSILQRIGELETSDESVSLLREFGELATRSEEAMHLRRMLSELQQRRARFRFWNRWKSLITPSRE